MPIPNAATSLLGAKCYEKAIQYLCQSGAAEDYRRRFTSFAYTSYSKGPVENALTWAPKKAHFRQMKRSTIMLPPRFVGHADLAHRRSEIAKRNRYGPGTLPRGNKTLANQALMMNFSQTMHQHRQAGSLSGDTETPPILNTTCYISMQRNTEASIC